MHDYYYSYTFNVKWNDEKKIGRDREVAESDIGWVGEGQVQKSQCVQKEVLRATLGLRWNL